MPSFIRLTVLFLWLFALVSPSVSLYFGENLAFIMTNADEEEKEESGKKSKDEEKFVKEYALDLSYFKSNLRGITDYFPNAVYTHFTVEVISPPPEKY